MAPTAAIGPFDCERLQVEIRLDNTRSTAAVTYGYGASFLRPHHAPFRGIDRRLDVTLAAGAAEVVVLPVRDDARTDVTVYLPDGGHVYSRGSCGDAPDATFGPSRCDTLRLPLTLDNSSSRRATRYRWALADPGGPLRSETVQVDAGDALDVDLPLVADSWTDVAVTIDGGGEVAASGRQSCGRIIAEPRAAFGVVDCADVSAPLILDNSRTTSRLRFHLPGGAVVLGGGETRSLRVHLPIRERLAVTVDDVLAGGGPTERAVTSTTRCAVAPPAPTGSAAGTVVAGDGIRADEAGATAPGADEAGADVAGADEAGAAAGYAVDGREGATAGFAPWTAIGASVLLLAAALGLLLAARRRPRTR